jgi:tetratricopeptide (TPR) repeat protein
MFGVRMTGSTAGVVVGVAMVVVATGALAFGAHDAAPVTARSYPGYTPTDGNTVVAQVAKRDRRELAMRAVLRESPDRVDVAVQLARADIQRSRALSDPRYLGRAQATLARWWSDDPPPPDVLLLRATIRQALHDFVGARADLDRVIAVHPADAQAQLTRAVVATVTADYAAAQASCAAVAELAQPIVAATCSAQIDGVTGHAAQAATELSHALQANADPALRGWAETALAELAIVRGDHDVAAAALRDVLALDPDDAYARAALADVLMWTGRPADASARLAGREAIDNLLVRRAIAEHLAHGPEAAKWQRAMQDRIAAAAERGDRIHMREEARFDLEVLGDARRALAIALDDWDVQKELADARLVAACAAAAGDPAAAAPVRAWMLANHVEDVQLATLLGGAR